MRVKLSLVVMTVILLATVSCNKVDNLKNVVDDDNTVVSSRLLTKAYGDKTPKLVGYVETNDVNPQIHHNLLQYYSSSCPTSLH